MLLPYLSYTRGLYPTLEAILHLFGIILFVSYCEFLDVLLNCSTFWDLSVSLCRKFQLPLASVILYHLPLLSTLCVLLSEGCDSEFQTGGSIS